MILGDVAFHVPQTLIFGEMDMYIHVVKGMNDPSMCTSLQDTGQEVHRINVL